MSKNPVTTSTSASDETVTDGQNPFDVSLLDVGRQQYGDAVLCRFGNVSVFVDGAHRGNINDDGSHRSIPRQLGYLLNQPTSPYQIDLLICTHLHEDHIGCLPDLVKLNKIRPKYALLLDPKFRWGDGSSDSADSPMALSLVEALLEEPQPDIDDAAFAELMSDSETLFQRYTGMIANLTSAGCNVIKFGTDSTTPLKNYLASKEVGFEILGPRKSDLPVCAELIQNWRNDTLDRIRSADRADSAFTPLSFYKQILAEAEAADGPRSSGVFINLESLVVNLTYQGKNFLLTGDMQMADEETNNATLKEGRQVLLNKVLAKAPYEFFKLPHHASWNGFSEEVRSKLKTTSLFGFCTGSNSEHHPSSKAMNVLTGHPNQKWVRTDRNGQVRMTFGGATPNIRLSYGSLNDPSLPQPSHDEPPISPSVETVPAVAEREISVGDSPIQVTIPKRARRVTITFELDHE